ncbi:MAG: DNA methyltransferase [Solirubrobacteraceae bacterium]
MNDPTLKARHPQADALNAICPYWTMFPLSFPLGMLADARSGEWVLDPFCGRGTTLYAARKLGLPAVGIDSNEVAAAIAAAKLVSVDPGSIVELAEEIIAGGSAAAPPEGEFWHWCFGPRVLDVLCRLRAGLAHRGDAPAVALRGVLMGALHGPRNKGLPSYLSNQMPRTYATKPKGAVSFWKARDMRPVEVDVLAIIRRHAERRYASVPPRTRGAVYGGDALTVMARLRRRFTWVITSPPYPGMVTYRPDGWLRGWLLGGSPAPDYNRDAQLGSMTGARFVAGLAEIWAAAARRCVPGARLIVRFGALPSARRGEPEDLLLSSLECSGAWKVATIEDAGIPKRVGSRQVEQALPAGTHVPEVDVVAIRRS